MRKLLINLFLLCTGKDGIAMMAMLWAQEIMNQETVEDAKKMYERVPRILKTKVKDILVRSFKFQSDSINTNFYSDTFNTSGHL